MKKTRYLFSIFTLFIFIACGGGDNTDKTLNESDNVSLKGLEELDLTQWGYNLSIMVPQEDLNGAVDVTLRESGALEVVVGMDYGVSIMFGEGDIELLKTDLDEHLFFISEILLEEKNALIYKQDVPEQEVKTQNHFLYKAEIGEDVYEVFDIKENSYGAGMIEKMLESAKTLKSIVTKKELSA